MVYYIPDTDFWKNIFRSSKIGSGIANHTMYDLQFSVISQFHFIIK